MVSRLLSAAIISSAMLVAAPALGQGSAPNAYEKLAAANSGALVNIKFILKAEGQEQEEETPGVIIEKDGLVLTSNVPFGGLAAKFGGPAVTPTNIKILIGDDTQGIDAKIIARDSELGLAWLKPDAPDAKGYSFVDFSKGVKPRAGDVVMVLSQLSKFFDRAGLVSEGRVAAITSKPRTLLIPSLALGATDFGVPAFDGEARPVGVFTIILPEREEIENAPGGMPEILNGIPGGKMILPADEVVAATKRAKELAASGAGEPAPAETPAPAPATTDAPKQPVTPTPPAAPK